MMTMGSVDEMMMLVKRLLSLHWWSQAYALELCAPLDLRSECPVKIQ
jgi:hypothetical protein